MLGTYYGPTSGVAASPCSCAGLAAPASRDTDDNYPKQVKLTDLSNDHWLRVNEIAFERLRHSKWMRLAKPNLKDDTYTYVDVQVKDLHTFAGIEGDNGGAFHVLPEAVLPEGKIRVCRLPSVRAYMVKRASATLFH